MKFLVVPLLLTVGCNQDRQREPVRSDPPIEVAPHGGTGGTGFMPPHPAATGAEVRRAPPGIDSIDWRKIPQQDLWVARTVLTVDQVEGLSSMPADDWRPEQTCAECAATGLTWCDAAWIVNKLSEDAGLPPPHTGIPPFGASQSDCHDALPKVRSRPHAVLDLPTQREWETLIATWVATDMHKRKSAACDELKDTPVPTAPGYCQYDEVFGICGLLTGPETYTASLRPVLDPHEPTCEHDHSEAGRVDFVVLFGTACEQRDTWPSDLRHPVQTKLTAMKSPAAGVRLVLRRPPPHGTGP